MTARDPRSEHCKHEFQRENWLFQERRLWLNMGRVGWDEACSLVQCPETLWLNGWHSDRGVNNCVPVTQKGEVRDSLKLIHLDEVGITVSPRLGGLASRASDVPVQRDRVHPAGD